MSRCSTSRRPGSKAKTREPSDREREASSEAWPERPGPQGQERRAMTSARKYPRTARLNEAVLEVLADELERMSDPRLELVTFTGVDVTRDLSYATVFYSTLGATTAGASETFAEDAATALESAGAHFRGVLGRSLRIRQ